MCRFHDHGFPDGSFHHHLLRRRVAHRLPHDIAHDDDEQQRSHQRRGSLQIERQPRHLSAHRCSPYVCLREGEGAGHAQARCGAQQVYGVTQCVQFVSAGRASTQVLLHLNAFLCGDLPVQVGRQTLGGDMLFFSFPYACEHDYILSLGCGIL